MRHCRLETYKTWLENVRKTQLALNLPGSNDAKHAPLRMIIYNTHLFHGTPKSEIYQFTKKLMFEYITMLKVKEGCPVYTPLLTMADYDPFPEHILLCLYTVDVTVLYRTMQTLCTNQLRPEVYHAIRTYGENGLQVLQDAGWWFKGHCSFVFLPDNFEKITDAPLPLTFTSEQIENSPVSVRPKIIRGGSELSVHSGAPKPTKRVLFDFTPMAVAEIAAYKRRVDELKKRFRDIRCGKQDRDAMKRLARELYDATGNIQRVCARIDKQSEYYSANDLALQLTMWKNALDAAYCHSAFYAAQAFSFCEMHAPAAVAFEMTVSTFPTMNLTHPWMLIHYWHTGLRLAMRHPHLAYLGSRCLSYLVDQADKVGNSEMNKDPMFFIDEQEDIMKKFPNTVRMDMEIYLPVINQNSDDYEHEMSMSLS